MHTSLRVTRLLGMIGLALALAAPASASAQICDAVALTGALSTASSGDVVRIGACRITGSFSVPSGVTLRGVDADTSVIAVPTGGYGVTLHAGADTAILRHLRIETDGRFGVFAAGTGSALVDHVRIAATRGIGVAAEGVGEMALVNVRIRGPVTAGIASTVPPDLTPSVAATHGVVFARVAHGSLDNVRIDGFAAFGGLFVNGDTALWDVSATDNVGVGLAVWGGSVTADDVAVRRTFRGMLPADEVATGVGFAGGATVTTEDLTASANQGWGVFHADTGIVEHDSLLAVNNDHAGVWIQDGAYLQLDDASLLNNAWAGVAAIDTTFLSMEGGGVMRTRMATPTGHPEAGDGVQLVGTAGDFFDLNLTGNQRAGLLGSLSTGQTLADYGFAGVRAAGGTGALGVVFQQGGAPLPLVTTGITRIGDVAANDGAFAAAAEIMEVTGAGVPDWWLPAEAVASLGIGALFLQKPGDLNERP